MLDNKYLYFRRVDTYKDDTGDGDQPIKDIVINSSVCFERNPEYKAYDYYKGCRARTYACCLSTKNSPYLWENYSAGDVNAICLVFDVKKLREFFNNILLNSKIIFLNQIWSNFFDINYGLVTYGDLANDVLANATLRNPVEYAYFKDRKYKPEKEFRITLSTIGLGKFVLPDGADFDFPESIKLDFDLQGAINFGAVRRIEISKAPEKDFIEKFYQKLLENKIEVHLGNV